MNQNQVPIQPTQPMQPQIVVQAAGPSGLDKGLAASASCGKFVGLSGAVVCAIIIVILCGFGIFFYRKKVTTVYNKVSATILDAKCSQVMNNSGHNHTYITYNCELKVKYTVDGKEYQNNVTSNDTVHNVGETREIYYNVANPNEIVYTYVTSKSIGEILIGVGSCFVILLIIHILLTMKSGWYNRLQCLSAASNIIASPFRS